MRETGCVIIAASAFISTALEKSLSMIDRKSTMAPLQCPIWVKDDEIHYDEAELQQHMLQNLLYNKDCTSRIKDQITELLSKTNRLNNFWNAAARDMSTEAIRVMLRSIEHSQLIYMLCYRDSLRVHTALHRCAVYKRSNVVKIILDSVSEEERFKLLSLTGLVKCSPLHDSCYRGDAESVRVMLNHVNQDMRYSLLQMTTNDHNTPLHYASHFSHTDIMKVIRESVTQTQWISLLQIEGEGDGMTFLQRAAYEDVPPSIEAIRDSVSDGVWIQLLCTPLPEFDGRCHYGTEYKQAVSKIEELRVEARVKSVLAFPDQLDRKTEVQRITETESLTVAQIQQLSPHISQYIIPHKQKKSRRYGLILFSSAGRQGAVEEAEDLEQALQTTGCDVIKMEWSDAVELYNMIESALSTKIVRDCSLLIVCLMSHGSRGEIASANGEKMCINDVLHKLSFQISCNTPMVVLLQACQTGTKSSLNDGCDPLPTQKSDPLRDQHITLTRPHTVLLLATVRGGLAKRGIFTGAMADEFRSADGRRDIYMMFTRASEKLATSTNQQSEFRSTARKTLIIPPATW